ncbi:MAG: hypothetical protein ABW167_03730 [Baekduia sp.]
MTERDAFGNPIEESRRASQPLTSGDPLASGDPLIVADAVPASAPAPAPDLAPRRHRRRLLGLGGCIGLLLFLAPLAIGGWFVYRAFDSAVTPTVDVIKDVREAMREADKTSRDASDDPPPRGLQHGSLLRPAAVDRLLGKVRANPGGKLLLLRLAPERADLQLSRSGGGMSIVQLRYDGGRSLVRTSAGGSASKAIIFSRIDRGAPARLVRTAARRLGRKTSSIDYLVLINILDGPRWSAYFKGGAAFQGDAHGKIVRRIQ